MKHTNRQPSQVTREDLCKAIARRHVVTITYIDRTGTESVRTIEPYDIRTTKKGAIQVRAMCRLREVARSFDLDRIASYTLHRIPAILEREEATTVDGHSTPARTPAQLIARELGRDEAPRYRRITQSRLAAVA
ncbi:WYL domain-containing protein [Streptomyces sp. NPDC015130]|uniref:WYL domain-containing protein n=1 Tax=Streptomyces sp. NPDC015130 TaxID=3364940 RepID=UPI003701AB42